MNDMLANGDEYLALFKQIADDTAKTRLHVTQGANSEVVRMCWRSGCEIDARATWGSKFIDTLSHDVRAAFPGIKGFSVRNLKRMAKFARKTSEELCNGCCTIPWGTITHLMIGASRVNAKDRKDGRAEFAYTVYKSALVSRAAASRRGEAHWRERVPPLRRASFCGGHPIPSSWHNGWRGR